MRKVDQIIGDEACKVRRDVESLRSRIAHLTGAIARTCLDDEKISIGIRKISRGQLKFNNRVDRLRSRLHATKSLLAIRQS